MPKSTRQRLCFPKMVIYSGKRLFVHPVSHLTCYILETRMYILFVSTLNGEALKSACVSFWEGERPLCFMEHHTIFLKTYVFPQMSARKLETHMCYACVFLCFLSLSLVTGLLTDSLGSQKFGRSFMVFLLFWLTACSHGFHAVAWLTTGGLARAMRSFACHETGG